MDPTTQSVNPEAVITLTSTAGIIALTILIVQFFKVALGEHAFFSKVPVVVYIVIIAALLTTLARLWLQKLNGDLADLLVDVFVKACSSAGLYSLFKGGGQTLGTLTKLLMISTMLMVVGCTDVRTPTLREGLAASAAEPHREYLELVQSIHDGKPLPKYTDNDVEIRKESIQKFDELIQADRANDGKSSWNPFARP